GTLQAAEGKELSNFGFLNGAIQLGDGHIFPRVHPAVKDTRNRETAQVVAVVEIRDQNLKRPPPVPSWSGNGFDDGIKERLQIFSATRDIGRGSSCLCIGIEHRELELLFVSVQIDKQIVNFVEHFLRTRIGAIN